MFDRKLFLIISVCVILVLLLWLFVIINYFRNRSYVPLLDPQKKNNRKVCILLTMYISDDKKRSQHYLDIIKKWIQNEDIDIFVVDSSGRKLIENPPQNLHQYSFEQQSKRSILNPSVKERDSIQKILDDNYDNIQSYDFIYKITGKYYIENFKQICIDPLPKDADFIYQNNTFTDGQNTELFGFRTSLANDFLSKITPVNNFESTVKKLQYNEKKYKIYRLPLIKIENKIRRSDGSVLKTL